MFVLNGRVLERHDASAPLVAPVMIRLGRKRRPAGAGYLVRDAAPLPEDLRGIAISTFGKVIKRGWDWLGLTPGAPEYVGGLIEVPALVALVYVSLWARRFYRDGSTTTTGAGAAR